MIESAFAHLLINNDNINNFFEDIEPHIRTDSLPMLSFRFIAYAGNYVSDTHSPRVQLDVWGNTYPEIKQGRQIVMNELHDWRGDMDGYAVKNIVNISDLESYNSDMKIWREIMDFRIIYQKGED